MAEAPFNPLGNLGPEYGSFQAPNMNPESFKPFEGDSLNDPALNIPFKPLVPNYPNNNQFTIKDNYQGHLGGNKPKPDIKAAMSAIFSGNSERNKYAKLYSYNAGPDGPNFYKRYAAFGSETFSKIGFTPFRDNEAIYNENTTWAQRWSRMMTHAAIPLFKEGFVSGPRSLMNMLSGDFSSDDQAAKVYGEASAIGTDTAGGFGSFINNMQMNFSYTAGIMTEAILEEAAGLLLAAPTGGASLAATTANIARKIPLAGKVMGLGKDVATGANAFRKSVEAANDINQARKIWSVAGAQKTFGSALGRFVNPLENTTESILKAVKNEDGLQGLARSYNTIFSTAGGFYRDVRAVNMALAEARLEGGFNKNEIYNGLYNKYYIENGHAPENSDQRKMYARAVEGGMMTQGWNTGLIYVSNKIVFPNIVGPRGGIKKFMNSKADDVLDLKFGKVTKTLNTDKNKFTYAYTPKSFKQGLKEYYKKPMKLAKHVATYTKANFMEGAQEVLQNVIAGATEKYYIDSYFNKANATRAYAEKLTDEAFKDQWSMEGAETFASGFLMGFMATPMNKSIELLSLSYNRIFDKENYDNYKNARKTYGERIVANLNATDVNDFFNSKIFNYGAQVNASEAIVNGTDKEAHDSSNDAFTDHVLTLLGDNSFKYVVEDLEAFKSMTPEEFKEAFNFKTVEEAQARQSKLDGIINKSKTLQKRYNETTEKFKIPVDVQKLGQLDKDSDEYTAGIYLYHAYNKGIKNLVFFQSTFEDTQDRMNKLIQYTASQDYLKNANYTDVELLFSDRKILNEIDRLKTDIKQSGDLGVVTKAEIAEKERKLEALQNLKESLNDHVNNPTENAEVLKKLETSFKDYLRVIGNVNNTFIFDNQIDEAFTTLKDFYQLAEESRMLADSINVLSNPEGFYDHIIKNVTWMKDLYKNRKQYYEEAVASAQKEQAANNLLNDLADKNLFIEPEDLLEFLVNGRLPNEIFDATTKAVLKPSNPLYAQTFAKFRLFLEEFVDKQQPSKAQDPELEKLDQKMKEEIDALEKVEVEEELTELVPTGKERSFKKIVEDMPNDSYVDLTRTFQGTERTTTLYKNSEGVIETDHTFKANSKFTKARNYKKVMVPDPAQVAEITQKYNDLKVALVEEAAKEELVEFEKAKGMLSTNSDWTQIEDKSVKDSIKKLFDESLAGEELSEDMYLERIQKFMLISPEVEDIIEKFNFRKEVSSDFDLNTKIVYRNEKDPVLLIDIPEEDLRSYLNELKQERLKYQEPLSPVDQQEANSIQRTINTIQKYLNIIDKTDYTTAQKEVIDRLETIGEVIPTADGYTIKGVLHDRVSTVVTKLADKEYQYADLTKLKASINSVFKGDGITTAQIKEFLENVQNKRLGGLGASSIALIKNELEQLKKDNPKVSKEALTDYIVDSVTNNAYEENRELGNYVDSLIRDYFSGVTPEFNSDKISKQAYDRLFASEEKDFQGDLIYPGLLKTIKDTIEKEGLYIYSKGLTLFDTDAKVAGTIDLILVDRKGAVSIVDIKTGNQSKWDKFNKDNILGASEANPLAGADAVEAYSLQQTVYSNLLYNMIGQEASISLLPIQHVSDENGKIIDIVQPSVVPDGKSRIMLSKNYKSQPDGKTVQEKVDEVIPKNEVPTQTLVSSDTLEIEFETESEEIAESKFSSLTPKQQHIQLVRELEQGTELSGKIDMSPSQSTGFTIGLPGYRIVTAYSHSLTPETKEGLRGKVATLKLIPGEHSMDGKQFQNPISVVVDGKVVGWVRETDDFAAKKEKENAEALEQYNNIKEAVTTASAQWVVEKQQELLMNLSKVLTTEQSNELEQLLEQRLEQLKTDNQTLSKPSTGLQKGDQLVAVKDVQSRNKNTTFVETGNIVQVVKITDNTVTVKSIKSPNKTKIVPITELDSMFKLKSEIMDKATTEKPTISEESAEVLKENNDQLKSFIEDKAKIEQLGNSAKNQSAEELKEKLFNNLKC